MVKLELRTDTAASKENPAVEAARIIQNIAYVLENGGRQGVCHDANGFVVGKWRADLKEKVAPSTKV